jgi:NADH-quinone oxidoreductase subunit E
MGSESMRSHINGKLDIDFGGTTENGDFTFLPVPCLGDCDHAPVMMVGDDLHRNLTEGKVDEIFSEYKSKE